MQALECRLRVNHVLAKFSSGQGKGAVPVGWQSRRKTLIGPMNVKLRDERGPRPPWTDATELAKAGPAKVANSDAVALSVDLQAGLSTRADQIPVVAIECGGGLALAGRR